MKIVCPGSLSSRRRALIIIYDTFISQLMHIQDLCDRREAASSSKKQRKKKTSRKDPQEDEDDK